MSERPATPPRKRYLFDDGRNVRRVLWLFYALCAAVLGAELVVDRHSAHSSDGFFGFYALFGFAAYALLVIVAEGLRVLVSRRRDYYDD